MVNFREMFDKITRFPKIERNIVIFKSCGLRPAHFLGQNNSHCCVALCVVSE